MHRRHALAAGAIFLFVASFGVLAQTPLAFVNQPLIPTSVTPGHAAFTLTVTGTNFVAGATVNWNGHPRTTTFVSSSELLASILSSDVAKKNTATITVTNPGTVASNPVYFPVGPTSSAVAFARRDYLLSLPNGTNVSAMAVGDFNNDGKVDVALAIYGSTIAVLLGNGNGTFQPPILTTLNLPNGSGYGCVGIDALIPGDFNGDGITDLSVGYFCGTGFGGSSFDLQYTALGAGDGTFSAVGDGSLQADPTVAADLNADGQLDTVGTNPDYDGVNWYPKVDLGVGSGLFTIGEYLTDVQAFSVTGVGDFNHDGILDLAIPGLGAFQYPIGLYAFQGNGDGTFQNSLFYPASGRFFNLGPALVADLNGDGNLDVAMDGFVFLGNGDGTFSLGSGTIYGGANALADLNNDGKLDAVSGSASGVSGITISLGNGDGTFQNPQSWFVPYYLSTAGNSPNLGVADLNDDGRLDIITAGTNLIGNTGTGPTTLSVFLQTSLSITPNYMDFGTLYLGTKSLPQTSTLTNLGHDTVSLGEIKLMGWKDSYTVTNNCGPTLGPGASCSITAVFAPKQFKTLNTSIYLTYSGAAGSPQLIALLGAGYEAGPR
jgi:hypothetical protein